jgi:ferredoxin
VQGKEGENLLDVVVNNNIDIDGFGACEGTLACSTCHLIFTPEVSLTGLFLCLLL